MRPPLRRRRTGAALLFPLAAAAVLAAGAWLDAARPEPFAPVWIERQMVHIGDDPLPRFTQAEPEGTSITRTFTLARIPERPLLVMDLSNVVHPGNASYLRGQMRDRIHLNGDPIAVINEHVPREDRAIYTVFLPVEPERLRIGENEIRVAAGKSTRMEDREVDGQVVPTEITNHDDFEWGRARLAAGCRLRVRAREKGEPVPARIQVLDAGGERRISFGPHFRASGAERAICTANGEAELTLPQGEPFDIWATRGIEYDAARVRLRLDGPDHEIELPLTRVVDTSGWISGDFHLHQAPSPDSKIPLEDRVIAVIAEGVEFAVSTDHNRITDLAPVVEKLGVGRWVLPAVGSEITSYDPPIGHWNAFPLALGRPPVPVVQKTATEIISAARDEYGARVVQVNHPRGGPTDYFNRFALDRRTGKATLPGYDDTFDAIEVFNGVRSPDGRDVVLRDWYAVLLGGRRVTGTGNSDSHRILLQEAGLPRNYIRVPDDRPDRTTVAAVAEAVRAGRVTVSSGPFLEVSANDAAVGETAAAPDGKVRLAVKVQAAPWVGVEQLQVVWNGTVVRRIPVASTDAVVRFDEGIDLEVDGDGFIVVLARGGRYDAPIALGSTESPMAFTHPIWIERKGD